MILSKSTAPASVAGSQLTSGMRRLCERVAHRRFGGPVVVPGEVVQLDVRLAADPRVGRGDRAIAVEVTEQRAGRRHEERRSPSAAVGWSQARRWSRQARRWPRRRLRMHRIRRIRRRSKPRRSPTSSGSWTGCWEAFRRKVEARVSPRNLARAEIACRCARDPAGSAPERREERAEQVRRAGDPRKPRVAQRAVIVDPDPRAGDRWSRTPSRAGVVAAALTAAFRTSGP